MSTNPVPMPAQDPIANPRREQYKDRKDPHEGLVTQSWLEWLTDLNATIVSAPSTMEVVSLTAQVATIGATDIAGSLQTGGIYRLSYYTRITTAGGVSSSLTIGLDWTDAGQAVTFTGAAMVANTVTTYQSGTQLIVVDSLSPIRYSTTYASVGVPAMAYKLSVILEKIIT